MALKKYRRKIARKLKAKRVSTLVKAWLLFLAPFIVASGAGLCAWWVFSNAVTVTWHDYTITLEADVLNPNVNGNVTLTATMKRTDLIPVVGSTIYLDRNDVEIANNVTDSNGQCTFTVTRDTQGSYTFTARTYIP